MTALPAVRQLPHEIGAADQPNQPPSFVDHWQPLQALRDQDAAHAIHRGRLVHRDHVATHHVGDFLTAARDQVVLADDAHQILVAAADGQTADAVLRQDLGRVVDRLDAPEIDVRVDLHDQTVAELRRILEAYKSRREYYAARCAHPGDAVPEEDLTL